MYYAGQVAGPQSAMMEGRSARLEARRLRSVRDVGRGAVRGYSE